jgi:hypothetical protein
MNIIEKTDFTNSIKDYIISLKHNWKIKLLQADETGAVVEG